MNVNIAMTSGGFDWAIVIAVLALLFSIATFWVLNARRGRLRSYAPQSFAAALLPKGPTLIRIPLVLYNTGAVPIIVQDLRLQFAERTAPGIEPLDWATTRTELKPHSGDAPTMPAVFVVDGRSAATHFIEFASERGKPQASVQPHQVTVLARLGHKHGWTSIVEFTLHLDQVRTPGNFISYRNAPAEADDRD